MLPPMTDDGVAVITGASSGIGEEIAREFARRGYRLVLVARRADRLRDLAEELAGRAYVLPADLSNRDQRATLFDQVAALGVVADILVNNAGLTTLGPVAEASPGAELNLIEVDVAAVVDLCSRFVPSMVKRGRGAVLNVASVGAFGPLPGQASYGAAKAFVLSSPRRCVKSCATPASPPPRCARDRCTPAFSRPKVFQTKRARERCRSSYGSTPTQWPRSRLTEWRRLRA